MSTNPTQKRFVQVLKAQLSDLALVSHGGILTWQAASDVLGWIGLNIAQGAEPGIVEVNPIVAVRHQPLERLVAEMLDEPFHKYAPPTVGANIGYLTPRDRYHPFYVNADEEVLESAGEDFVTAYRTYGVPFVLRNRDLIHLVESLQRIPSGSPDSAHYRLPAAYILMGQDGRAAEYVKEQLARLCARHDAAAERYRKFAENLLAQSSRTRPARHTPHDC